MIANITSGKEINGLIMYNENKVIRGEAELIDSNYVITYNLNSKKDSFAQHHITNLNTKNVVFHASLSVAEGVKFSDENFIKAAEIYMDEMGYKDQPYLVYKHNDREHPHIHIVSSRVNRNGKKISDSLERVRSQKALDKIIEIFQLPKVERKKQRDNLTEKYKPGTKYNMYGIISYVQKHYKPCNLMEYNQFLKKFDMRIQHKKGETKNGIPYEGLNYINSTIVKGEERKNNKILQEETCIKSSNFNNIKSLAELQAEFMINSQKKKENLVEIKKSLLPLINLDKKISLNQFNKFINDREIEVIYSKNKKGINGISFVDQKSKFYYKASEISKDLSYNNLKKLINFDELLKNEVPKEFQSGLDKMKDERDIYVQQELEKISDYEKKLTKEEKPIKDYNISEKKTSSLKNTDAQDNPILSKKKRRTI